MKRFDLVRFPTHLRSVEAPSQIFVPQGQKGTVLTDFSERRHSTREAHVVSSTSVHKEIQEGAQESLQDLVEEGGKLAWGPVGLWQSRHLSPVPTRAQGPLILSSLQCQ